MCNFLVISTHQFLWIIIKIFLFGLLWKSRGTFSLINYWTFWHSGFRSCFLFCYGKTCLCMLFTCYFGYRLRRSSIHAFDVYSPFAYVFFGYQSSFLCLTDFKEVMLRWLLPGYLPIATSIIHPFVWLDRLTRIYLRLRCCSLLESWQSR
jgi:hypothetical protein